MHHDLNLVILLCIYLTISQYLGLLQCIESKYSAFLLCMSTTWNDSWIIIQCQHNFMYNSIPIMSSGYHSHLLQTVTNLVVEYQPVTLHVTLCISTTTCMQIHALTLLYHEETEVEPFWISFDMKCGLNEDTTGRKVYISNEFPHYVNVLEGP